MKQTEAIHDALKRVMRASGHTYATWFAKLPASRFASPQEIAACLAAPPPQAAKRPKR